MYSHTFFSFVRPLTLAATAPLFLSNAASLWARPLSAPPATHRIRQCPGPNPGTIYTAWKIDFYTLDWAKKGDTAVTVQVRAHPGVIAHYNGFGASDNSHCLYDKGDHHVLNLAKDVPSYPSSEGATRLRLRIDPPGKDTWTFRYVLTARTSTGAWETMKSGYGLLDSVHRDVTIN